jgi:hypothetical protein
MTVIKNHFDRLSCNIKRAGNGIIESKVGLYSIKASSTYLSAKCQLWPRFRVRNSTFRFAASSGFVNFTFDSSHTFIFYQMLIKAFFSNFSNNKNDLFPETGYIYCNVLLLKWNMQQ